MSSGSQRGSARAFSGAGDHFAELRSQVRFIAWPLVYIGFLAYIFAITTYRLPIGSISILIALLGLLLQPFPLRISPPLPLFIAFLTWCALGLVQSSYSDVVLEAWTDLAKLGLIVLAAVNALRTRSQIRFFIIFWLVCFALFPLRGTYINFFLTHYNLAGRAIWNYIYANPNDLAVLGILQLSLVAGLLGTERGWIRIAAILGTCTLTLLIFMTQSRGAFLGLAAFGLFAFAGSRRKLRGLALAVVIGGVVLMAAPEGVWERLGGLSRATNTADLSAVDEEGSAQARFQIWQVAFRIIRDHPVFGVGFGAYAEAHADYAPATTGEGRASSGLRDTHSTYFNVTAETGYPGLLIFLSLIGSTVYYAERVRRRCKPVMPGAARQLYFLELGILGFLVSGIFGSYARLSFLYLHLVLIFVLAKVCEEDLQALWRRRSAGTAARAGTRVRR